MEDDDQKQQLLTAIWYSVNEIAKHEAQSLGKEVSEAFVASLAEIVLEQMQTMAMDLEAFATHARRAVISMDDVKLCARRNDSLYAMISEAAKDIQEEASSKRKKK
ncbi:kinetochore component CENP-S-domain-containing protein [Gilbertella persicaria]|uniref:kinetochore component CENP-S-domain-containing protein n=1 Tax=Gilbertella persicaria TaxID=101096 RepID=UPI002220109C|nr:kinetochore component CENP-S-domain-containing protein [Gilbertella persicaria]KAI8087691.1 kinetochore component CENP-S-domain-containing protein [Gilbertella persicaria]